MSLPPSLPYATQLGLVVGLGAGTTLGWEIAEYYTFIRHGTSWTPPTPTRSATSRWVRWAPRGGPGRPGGAAPPRLNARSPGGRAVMERVHVLRAARDGTIVVLATVAVVIWQDREESKEKLIPADVTLTEAVEPGSHQLQFLIRGAGCDQADTSERGYKEPKERVKAPTRRIVENSLVITYMVEDPGKFACRGFDPGVPKTITLELPVGDLRLLDGTKDPPAPFQTGPPRTLPFGVIPDASPSATPGATHGLA